jgi:hypothetical protein
MSFAKTRIMAVDATGSDLRLVNLGAGNCPTISPDGQRVAFFLNPGAVEGEESGVWLMDGIVPKQLDSFVLICYDCAGVIMELFVLCKDARQWLGLFRKNSIDFGL